MNGKKIKIHRLKNKGNFYCFLALDHQLSVGYNSNLSELKKWISFGSSSEIISAVVLNRGGLDTLPSNFKKPIIPQVIGGPVLNGHISKVSTMSIKTAIAYGADCISAQINFEENDSLSQFSAVAKVVEKSNEFGLPILLMVNIKNMHCFNFGKFINFVKISEEIGVDFIKINSPQDITNHTDSLKNYLSGEVKLLLAGGTVDNEFLKIVKHSKRVGFDGLCVGRNIFESNWPSKVLEKISKIYSE